MAAPDPATLRSAFGRFMTGITVVTTCAPDGTPVGFTANSFTSVSMDPPLLLVCPGQSLSSYASFANCTHFAVCILAEGQEDISNTFAGFKGDRFARVPHHLDLHGVPVIDDAIARFSCTTHDITPMGDHCLLIGQVRDLSQTDTRGLGFVGGRYFSLGLERAALESGPDTVICGAIIENAGRILLEKTSEGYRPPQIVKNRRGGLAEALARELETRYVPARLGQVYSVYDDAPQGRHHVYYLATAPAPLPNLTAVPIADLAGLGYASPALAQMMTRFALEAQTRSFSLYLGSAHEGDTHPITERT